MIDALPAASLTRTGTGGRTLTVLFALSLFSSAFLLFSLEPMVAKALLPKLGGTPMVWNTCMVFFQAVLLAGYGAAHATAGGRFIQRLWWLYPVVLAAGAMALPLTFTSQPGTGDQPVAWLLLELVRVAGVPVLGLSMSAPLLQATFSRTRLPGAGDPYFLYAASNAGSLLALLLYPTVIEPWIGLQMQSVWWAAIYVASAAAAGACVIAARPARSQTVSDGGSAAGRVIRLTDARSLALQRLRWIGLAFIPSSLMLGVTTHISTDIASVPLIWIVPLALYLATFVVAFGRVSSSATRLAERYVPLLAVALVFSMAAGVSMYLALSIPLDLAMFAAVALMCHGRLAEDRPAPARLTEFYFLLSVGGVLGGIFNTLIAPLLFTTVAEYSVVLLIACAVPALRWRGTTADAARDVAYALATGVLFAAINLIAMSPSTVRIGYGAAGAVAVATFSQSRRLVRFPLMLAAIAVASYLAPTEHRTVLHAERTFFGSYRVSDDAAGRLRMLTHGTTNHGMESLESNRRLEPLTYFHRSGPFGQAFERVPVMRNATDAAVVGLGIGSLAAYAIANAQRWTFYEIDPAVERIARDTRYFSLLDGCAARCQVVLGDARLSLARSAAQYDFIVLDAFSSDSIPMHLLTREAVDGYLEHLKPDGVVLFHISNRYLQLQNLVARIANDRGLTVVMQRHRIDAAAAAQGQSASVWLLASADQNAIAMLTSDSRWKVVHPPSNTPLWTDDFSNILAALPKPF